VQTNIERMKPSPTKPWKVWKERSKSEKIKVTINRRRLRQFREAQHAFK